MTVPMLRRILHAGLMILLFAAFGVRAEQPAQPIPADGQCPVAADEHWTPQERFVWSRVCVGAVADFNAEPDYGGDLDPKRPEGLPDNRVLHSTFIEAMLLAGKYRNSLTRNGVHIAGARFIDVLDLGHAELAHELWLDRSLLEKGANFAEARSTQRIVIDRTRALGPISMQDTRFEHDVTIRRSELTAVSLNSSHIGGGLNLDSSKFTGELDFASLRLADILDLSNSEFGDMTLAGANVDASIVLLDAKSTGQLILFGIEVGGHLLMNQGEFKDVNAAAAHIHGHFGMPRAKITGMLNMNAIRVDGNLAINDQADLSQVQMVNAHVIGSLAFTGAKVRGSLNMTNLLLDGILDMSSGGEFAEIGLINAQIGGLVALAGSKVSGPLNIAIARIGGDLVMNDKAEFVDVRLVNARVLGDLDVDGAKVSGFLDMEGLHLDGSLNMNSNGEFSQVSLANAHVGGSVNLGEGSKVHGLLNMFGLQLAGALYMNGKAEFTDIDLMDARIGELLNLRDSKVAGALTLESIEVHGDAFLSGGAEFSGPVNLIFGNVGELELGDATFHGNVDVTGAQIRSDLVLGPAAARWPGESTLILHNARADAIQDTSDAWPAKLDLTGFSYRSLGGVHPNERDRMADRSVKWLTRWLAREPYSPQPYAQLATVLRDAGRSDAADDILYAGKQRERQQEAWPQRLWLTALDWTVGYGYHVERALFWVVGFILAGVIVLRVSGEGRRYGMPFGLAYSFDLLLPIIRLREMHYKIDLEGWSRYYFYVHKIMGYVLASFLVVGVSGLVK
jgi:hypothetical protein